MADSKDVETVMETSLPLPLVAKGKVRDIYEVGDDKLLIVTSDRLSAFDVVLPNPIPNKGKVLNQISEFWFDYFKDLVPNHIITSDVAEMGFGDDFVEAHGKELAGRSILVRRCQPLAIECIVRGYVTGSGWKDYLKTGSICGHPLPEGLQQCERLPQTLFTPSTKAEEGHDENISVEEAAIIVGEEIASKIEKLSIDIYEKGAAFALQKGIMIADTKFEFGTLDGEIVLIDEVLTPDSSRFWPQEKYQVGQDQPSYDKQIVRNHLEESQWDKNPPGPALPEEVVEKTSQSYQEVFERLTGNKLS